MKTPTLIVCLRLIVIFWISVASVSCSKHGPPSSSDSSGSPPPAETEALDGGKAPATPSISADLQQAVHDAVIDYYQHHVPRALLFTKLEQIEDPKMRASLIRLTFQPLRYEIRNSFKRTVGGEVHQFCDVAVESKHPAMKIVELLPFDLVKRGDAWYSQIDPEREIQQLQNNGLSDNAVSLLSPEQQQAKEAEAQMTASAKANELKLQDYQRLYERLRDSHLFLQAALDDKTGALVEQFGIRGDRESSSPAMIDVENKDKFVSILRTFLDWCEKSRAAQLPKFDRLLGEFENHLSEGRKGYLRNLQFSLRYDSQSPPYCQLVGGGAIFSPTTAEAAIDSIQTDLPSLLQEARGAHERNEQQQKRIDDVLAGKPPSITRESAEADRHNDPARQQNQEFEKGTITDQIQEVVSSWQQLSNGNDPTREAMLYTEPVDYLDEGLLRHEQLVVSLADDRRKYPYQHYQVTSQPQFQEMDDGSYEVTFQFQFDRLDTARTKHRTGSGTMTWTLVNDQGAGLKIKQVRTKVVVDKPGDRRAKTDAPPKWLQKLFGNPPGR